MLVGIYASQHKRAFFQKVIKKIVQFSEGSLIVMGDFNSVIDANMDKSGQTIATLRCHRDGKLVDQSKIGGFLEGA